MTPRLCTLAVAAAMALAAGVSHAQTPAKTTAHTTATGEPVMEQAPPASFVRTDSTGVTAAYAKTQIVGDGFTNPTNIQPSNGGFTADATELGKPVHLFVTQFGVVQRQ